MSVTTLRRLGWLLVLYGGLFDIQAAFNRNPFWVAAEQARDGEELLAKVRALGVTHVFLSAEQLVLRQDSPGRGARSGVYLR